MFIHNIWPQYLLWDQTLSDFRYAFSFSWSEFEWKQLQTSYFTFINAVNDAPYFHCKHIFICWIQSQSWWDIYFRISKSSLSVLFRIKKAKSMEGCKCSSESKTTVQPEIVSIHLFSNTGSRGGWSLSQLPLGKRWGTSCPGHQLMVGLIHTDKQPSIHTRIYT